MVRASFATPRATGLLDPPGGVGGELAAAPPVELVDGGDQAQRSLLDQVEQLQPAPLITFRDRNNESQVRFDHASPSGRVASFDPLRKLHFLHGGEQRDAANLAEIETKQIAGPVGQRRGAPKREDVRIAEAPSDAATAVAPSFSPAQPFMFLGS
jgi:hypothetical protein